MPSHAGYSAAPAEYPSVPQVGVSTPAIYPQGGAYPPIVPPVPPQIPAGSPGSVEVPMGFNVMVSRI